MNAYGLVMKDSRSVDEVSTSDTNAPVAQWQSACVKHKRLSVRFTLGAPELKSLPETINTGGSGLVFGLETLNISS